MNLIDSIATLFAMKQGDTEPNDSFLERFKSNVNTVDLSHGKYVFCPITLIKPADLACATEEEKKKECEKMKAVLMLKNSDYKRYGALSNRLREGVTLGRNEYHTTIAVMYEVMVQQKQNNHKYNRNHVSLIYFINVVMDL